MISFFDANRYGPQLVIFVLKKQIQFSYEKWNTFYEEENTQFNILIEFNAILSLCKNFCKCDWVLCQFASKNKYAWNEKKSIGNYLFYSFINIITQNVLWSKMRKEIESSRTKYLPTVFYKTNKSIVILWVYDPSTISRLIHWTIIFFRCYGTCDEVTNF